MLCGESWKFDKLNNFFQNCEEEKLREENDYLPTMKKDIIYHINQSAIH